MKPKPEGCVHFIWGGAPRLHAENVFTERGESGGRAEPQVSEETVRARTRRRELLSGEPMYTTDRLKGF